MIAIRCPKIKPRAAWRILAGSIRGHCDRILAVAAAIAWATGDSAEAIAILVVLDSERSGQLRYRWQAGLRSRCAAATIAHEFTRADAMASKQPSMQKSLFRVTLSSLNAGDRVPADARLLEAVRLEAEESALTGESTTVEKDVAVVLVQTPLAERRSDALSSEPL